MTTDSNYSLKLQQSATEFNFLVSALVNTREGNLWAKKKLTHLIDDLFKSLLEKGKLLLQKGVVSGSQDTQLVQLILVQRQKPNSLDELSKILPIDCQPFEFLEEYVNAHQITEEEYLDCPAAIAGERFEYFSVRGGAKQIPALIQQRTDELLKWMAIEPLLNQPSLTRLNQPLPLKKESEVSRNLVGTKKDGSKENIVVRVGATSAASAAAEIVVMQKVDARFALEDIINQDPVGKGDIDEMEEEPIGNELETMVMDGLLGELVLELNAIRAIKALRTNRPTAPTHFTASFSPSSDSTLSGSASPISQPSSRSITPSSSPESVPSPFAPIDPSKDEL